MESRAGRSTEYAGGCVTSSLSRIRTYIFRGNMLPYEVVSLAFECASRGFRTPATARGQQTTLESSNENEQAVGSSSDADSNIWGGRRGMFFAGSIYRDVEFPGKSWN